MKALAKIVSIAVEFDANDIFAHYEQDANWCERFADASGGKYLIDISGETKVFFSKVAQMSSENCSQKFISAIKYARDIGAWWVIVNC